MDRETIMNKTDLIEFIAERAEMTKAAAARMLDAVLYGITDALQKNDPVVIAGFCSLTIRKRAARMGYNPATGEKINIKATKVIGFKAGKALKEAIKEKDI